MRCDVCGHMPHLAGCPNAPQPEPVEYCSRCGRDLYPGDVAYYIDRTYLCEDCVEDLKEILEGD